MACRGMKAVLGADPYHTLLHSPRSPGSGPIPAFRASTPCGATGSLRSTGSAGLTVVRAGMRAGDTPDSASASDCGSDCGSLDFLEPLAAACERLPPAGPPLATLTVRSGALPDMASMAPTAVDTRAPPQALVRDIAVDLLRGMQTMAQVLTQRFGRRSPQVPAAEHLGATLRSPLGGTMTSPAPPVLDRGLRPQSPGGSDCSSGSDDGSGSEAPLPPLQHRGGSRWASRDEAAAPWVVPGTGPMHGDSAAEHGRAGPRQPIPGTIQRGMHEADTMRALHPLQPPPADSPTPSRFATPPRGTPAFLRAELAMLLAAAAVAFVRHTCLLHSDNESLPLNGDATCAGSRSTLSLSRF